MKLVRTLAGCPLALALTCWVTPALANKTAGRVQVGVTTPVFTMTKLTETHKVSGEDSDTAIDATEWGVRREVAGEVGYGSGKVAVLGLIFQLGGSSTTADPELGSSVDVSNFNIMVGPKLDLMLRYGKTVRPYFGLAGGYASGWVTDEGIASNIKVEESFSGWRAMGRLGVRLFGDKTFSFDPAFVFTYQKDSITREVNKAGEYDVSSAGYRLGLVFGFSGWL